MKAKNKRTEPYQPQVEEFLNLLARISIRILTKEQVESHDAVNNLMGEDDAKGSSLCKGKQRRAT